jgi:hypothetical protein
MMMFTANEGPVRIQHKWLVPIYVFLMMCTANEGLVRIQYKSLVPIYVFPEIKLRVLIISKTEL